MRDRLFLVAFGLILAGSLAAWYVQTDGGAIHVVDVRFVGAAGNRMSALLYIPPGATGAHPAPAILAVHGYINSRETQSGFAIEFARRGFVVLAPDQTGHGYSDPPAFARGFGGPDALAYLRSLPFVDGRRIGLEGHSMGGWAVQMAAAAFPEGYTSMVLEGSSTGTLGVPDGTPATPKNLEVVFSRFDEFSQLMWETPIPGNVAGSAKLMQLFGTSRPVQADRLYGDVDLGTARRFVQPAVTHPGDHLSTHAIAAAISWFEMTLHQTAGPKPLEQRWYWKEFATLAALVGVLLLIFPLVDLLLGQHSFARAVSPPLLQVDLPPLQRIAGLAAAAVLPIVAFFPLQAVASLIFPPNSLFPQAITNGVLMWALGSALLTSIPFLIWLRRSPFALPDLGLPVSRTTVSKAALAALTCCGVLYLVSLAVEFFFHVDFRFWVVALKPLSQDQWGIFLIYLPFFAIFFLALGITLHGVEDRYARLGPLMARNGALLSGGFLVLLAVQYIPLLAGGTLTLASQPLLSIVAFQFVPLMLTVALVSTYCFRRTHNVYTGGFINAVLVTWYMVAGTATQAAPFWD